ncbi:hypothetical protein ACP70R_003265 [Stipagrostis hirtigluma subsp. patula]
MRHLHTAGRKFKKQRKALAAPADDDERSSPAMKSQVRTALLSTLPGLISGKAPGFSSLRRAVSTLQRRRSPLLHPASRAALSTLPSSSLPTVAALDSSSQTPAAAEPQGPPIPMTASTCTLEMPRGRHVFKIAGYSLLKGLGVGEFVRSDTFTIGGYDWCIKYYPNGESDEISGGDDNDDDECSDEGSDYDEDDDDDDDEAYVAVFLELLTKEADVWALYDLRLVDPAAGPSPSACSGKETTSLFSETGYSSWGYEKFRKRSYLDSSQYLQDDSLMIQCDITVIKGTPVPQSTDGPQKFLDVDKMADITFEVKGEVFHAHKFVLAMRSPVFKAELHEQQGEKNRQRVTIDDMEPAVFKALLHFIYTDTLPAMDGLDGHERGEVVKGLLVAAERFALEKMKVICESMLCERLSAGNVMTTLALADQHRCAKLKDACIRFITSSHGVDERVR